MRKKSGGSEENTFNPTDMIKEDPARRAGRADDVKGEYPKLIESAQLAIDDCEESYETAEEEAKEVAEGKE